MLFVTSSYLYMIVSIAFVYLLRCILNDDIFNNSNVYKTFLLAFVGIFVLQPSFTIYPILLLTISLPIIKINKSAILTLKNHTVIYVLFNLVFIPYILFDSNEEKRAYLHHGVWANSTYEYSIDSLKSKNTYSYSELVKILKADTISVLSPNVLDSYTELWIITPTKPFSKQELLDLKKWVAKGGNLIISSDHTDLYGHARCVNQIANIFNCKIGLSATYNTKDEKHFKNAKGDLYPLKTGTSFKGFAFPLWSEWLWEEDAYYMENNFFGPLSPSGDDDFSIKILLAQLPYWLGQVSFIQDSTIFANFCLYQPYTLQLIKHLSAHSYLCRAYIALLLFLILIIFFEYCNFRKYKYSLLIFAMFFLIEDNRKNINLHNTDIQYWSGNKDFVMENGCPYTTISTAYSLSPLSNKKPLWVDNIDLSEDDVIWVDSIMPPNPKWRWIKIQDIHLKLVEKSKFSELYAYLNVQCLANEDKIYKSSFDRLEVNSIFNDVIMNDWWYDSGILENRLYRINKWIAWLNKDSIYFRNKIFHSNFSDSLYEAVLYIDKKEPIRIKLPKPINDSGNVYFDNGIAGKIIKKDKSISILGLKQYQENIYAPNIWAIDYE